MSSFFVMCRSRRRKDESGFFAIIDGKGEDIGASFLIVLMDFAVCGCGAGNQQDSLRGSDRIG